MNRKRRKHALDIPLFFTGFILSVIFVLFLLGMLLVYSHIAETGTVETTPLFSVERTDRTVTVCLVGERAAIDLDIYRQIEPLLQKLCVFLPPRPRAIAACWNGLRLWQAGERPQAEKGPAPGYSAGAPG